MDPQKLADYIRNDLEWVPKNDLFFKDDKIKVDYCT